RKILAGAVGLDEASREAYEPTPGALAYSAYMAWLALYGSDAEVAAGFLVNFAAWGANCGRMSAALRSRYNLVTNDTKFFDLFAASPAGGGATATAPASRIDAPAARERRAMQRRLERNARPTGEKVAQRRTQMSLGVALPGH